MTRLGSWIQTGSPVVTEVVVRGGADFVILDLQHGFGGFESAVQCLQILDLMTVPSFVRISVDETNSIPRYLDAGAEGVILASVENASQVRQAADVMRYQPSGSRSYGGQRLGLRAEPPTVSAISPELHVMIETAGGLGSIEEIAATGLVAGFFVGPADLALAFDLEPGSGPKDERWSNAVDKVGSTCGRHGLVAGAAVSPDDIPRWTSVGYEFLAVGSDVGLLREGATKLFSRRSGEIDSTQSAATTYGGGGTR